MDGAKVAYISDNDSPLTSLEMRQKKIAKNFEIRNSATGYDSNSLQQKGLNADIYTVTTLQKSPENRWFSGDFVLFWA